jgi:rubredoxin
MVVNLKCRKCKAIYDFEVGNVSMDDKSNLVFENITICPKCGAKGEDLLSEKGQGQMTNWFFSQK